MTRDRLIGYGLIAAGVVTVALWLTITSATVVLIIAIAAMLFSGMLLAR